MITQMVFLATSLLRSGSCHLLRPHVNQSTVPCTLLLAFIHSLKSTPDTHPVPEAEHRSENKTNRTLAPLEGALPSACTHLPLHSHRDFLQPCLNASSRPGSDLSNLLSFQRGALLY